MDSAYSRSYTGANTTDQFHNGLNNSIGSSANGFGNGRFATTLPSPSYGSNNYGGHGITNSNSGNNSNYGSYGDICNAPGVGGSNFNTSASTAYGPFADSNDTTGTVMPSGPFVPPLWQRCDVCMPNGPFGPTSDAPIMRGLPYEAPEINASMQQPQNAWNGSYGAPDNDNSMTF